MTGSSPPEPAALFAWWTVRWWRIPQRERIVRYQDGNAGAAGGPGACRVAGGDVGGWGFSPGGHRLFHRQPAHLGRSAGPDPAGGRFGLFQPTAVLPPD